MSIVSLMSYAHMYTCSHIEDYMSDKVTHVVTLESWDANFDQVQYNHYTHKRECMVLITLAISVHTHTYICTFPSITNH